MILRIPMVIPDPTIGFTMICLRTLGSDSSVYVTLVRGGEGVVRVAGINFAFTLGSATAEFGEVLKKQVQRTPDNR